MKVFSDSSRILKERGMVGLLKGCGVCGVCGMCMGSHLKVGHEGADGYSV